MTMPAAALVASSTSRPLPSVNRKAVTAALREVADGLKTLKNGRWFHCVPGLTRTGALRFRKPTLYPTELRGRVVAV